MDLGKDLKNLLLAGIGAVAVTAEKSQALLDELVKKGELTVEQGKVLNEELKHNVEKKIKDSVTVQVVPTTGDELMRCIEDLTPNQLAALKAKLDALKPEEAAQPFYARTAPQEAQPPAFSTQPAGYGYAPDEAVNQ